MSIHIDKQVMSTIYTNLPHGKVEYQNTGLPNYEKQMAGGMSSLSGIPTRFIIKNFDDLCAGFVLITDSFKDPKQPFAIDVLTTQAKSFQDKVIYIHNLKENNQLLPKYIVDYVEKERNYLLIMATAEKKFDEKRKKNETLIEEEKPTKKLLNDFNTKISNQLLYKNYSVATQTALAPHTKTLHFVNLDAHNAYLDYKKKLSVLQPVLRQRILAVDSYSSIECKDANRYIQKERARLFNVENQIKRFLKNC
jgi:hypothetical protein